MCGQIAWLAKDFHHLLRGVGKLSNNQAKIVNYEEDLSEFTLEIKPNDGPYKRGKFEFKIQPNEDPSIAPNVLCLTEIYHPNINGLSNGGDICLSLLDEWTDVNDLQDCVQGLLFLFYEPNLADPLTPYFDPDDADQIEQFENNVQLSLEGQTVDGVEFDRNIVDDGDDNSQKGEYVADKADCDGKLKDDGKGIANGSQNVDKTDNMIDTDKTDNDKVDANEVNDNGKVNADEVNDNMTDTDKTDNCKVDADVVNDNMIETDKTDRGKVHVDKIDEIEADKTDDEKIPANKSDHEDDAAAKSAEDTKIAANTNNAKEKMRRDGTSSDDQEQENKTEHQELVAKMEIQVEGQEIHAVMETATIASTTETETITTTPAASTAESTTTPAASTTTPATTLTTTKATESTTPATASTTLSTTATASTTLATTASTTATTTAATTASTTLAATTAAEATTAATTASTTLAATTAAEAATSAIVTTTVTTTTTTTTTGASTTTKPETTIIEMTASTTATTTTMLATKAVSLAGTRWTELQPTKPLIQTTKTINVYKEETEIDHDKNHDDTNTVEIIIVQRHKNLNDILVWWHNR